jgi:hypothetical protein
MTANQISTVSVRGNLQLEDVVKNLIVRELSSLKNTFSIEKAIESLWNETKDAHLVYLDHVVTGVMIFDREISVDPENSCPSVHVNTIILDFRSSEEKTILCQALLTSVEDQIIRLAQNRASDVDIRFIQPGLFTNNCIFDLFCKKSYGFSFFFPSEKFPLGHTKLEKTFKFCLEPPVASLFPSASDIFKVRIP